MKIQTKYHGNITIAKEDIWQFATGLPGFLDEHQFVVLPLPDNEFFFILQSVQTPTLGFVITNPFSFFRDYNVKLDDITIEQLDIHNEADVQVQTILTVQDPFSNSTANLQAPLILNVRNKQAKQIIMNDEHYRTKHPLFKETAIEAGE